MDETKACPYCGEQVLTVAIKCKHCGSAIDVPTSTVKGQLTARPAYKVAGAIILVLIIIVLFANVSRTGTVSGNGFSDADVQNIERDIREKYANGSGATVQEVQLIRESPTKLSGYVTLKQASVGTIQKTCSATMGVDAQIIWECK